MEGLLSFRKMNQLHKMLLLTAGLRLYMVSFYFFQTFSKGSGIQFFTQNLMNK